MLALNNNKLMFHYLKTRCHNSQLCHLSLST